MTQPSPDGSAWPTAAPEDRPDAAYPDTAPDPVFAAGPPEWPPPGTWPGGTADPVPATPYEQGAAAYQHQIWEQDAWERARGVPPEEPAAPRDDDLTVQFPPVRDAETVEGEVVWHQQPPTGPFRAKHEKPGEWHTEPPEHLAFEHSPPAEVQPGVQDDVPAEAIPLGMLPQPWQVPFDPRHTEPHPGREPARPGRRHTGRWVALAALLTVLLLGAGAASAYLLLRDADSGRGSPDPATAVDRFMTEVYTRQDATAAGDLVCREARDEAKIAGRVREIQAYANEYPAPSYAWEQPAVSANTGTRATVDVQLTMTTDDERAVRQQLTFTVIRKTGWLVCDVTSRA